MLKQIFVTGPLEMRAAGGASALLGIVLVACAGWLAGCVTSSDDVAVGPPDFQSGAVASTTKPVPVSNALGSQSGAGTAPKAVAGAVGSAPKTVRTVENYGYTVGPMDVLEITVFKVPELSMKGVQVADTGTINVPLLGEVPAAGRTAQEIERDLTKQLGAKYLKSPQVTVFVKEHNSQMVTIEGAVVKPGVYPIQGKLSLVRLVATAGGLNNDLYDKEVKVFRTIGGERTSNVYDIDEIRAGKAADPALHQGDVVVVDNNAGKVAMQTALKILPGAASLGMVGATVGD
jgi:polysaccharide export outer membrane protein